MVLARKRHDSIYIIYMHKRARTQLIQATGGDDLSCTCQCLWLTGGTYDVVGEATAVSINTSQARCHRQTTKAGFLSPVLRLRKRKHTDRPSATNTDHADTRQRLTSPLCVWVCVPINRPARSHPQWNSHRRAAAGAARRRGRKVSCWRRGRWPANSSTTVHNKQSGNAFALFNVCV
jgi:hypothetical protein